MMPVPNADVFDLALLRARRVRAAENFKAFDFIYQRAQEIIIDGCKGIKRTFPRVALSGMANEDIALFLRHEKGASDVVVLDLLDPETQILAQDYDLIVSLFDLQWSNHLPQLMQVIHYMLKTDGLFMACFAGGQTLMELRQALAIAEEEMYGGISPRVSPMIDVQAAAQLLYATGFSLPVADVEVVQVDYQNPLTLLHDLKGMGATNVMHRRSQRPMTRGFRDRALQHYRTHFASGAAHANGAVATFELISLLGWAPHPDQPQPLARGSGAKSLREALNPQKTAKSS